MKKMLWGVFGILVVIVVVIILKSSGWLIGGIFILSAPKTDTTVPPPAPPATASVIIKMTEAGFDASEITIKKGETVQFVNNGTADHWPASNIHPTHTIYPGSDIQKCGTAEQSKIFDACRGLHPKETWSFKFDDVGSWRFHDHLFPNLHGTIIVKE